MFNLEEFERMADKELEKVTPSEEGAKQEKE